MTKSIVSSALLAVSTVSIGLLTCKAPHLNLLGRIMAGEFLTEAAPVRETPATNWQEATVPLQLDSLVVDVPRTLLPHILCSDDHIRMRAYGDGLCCLLFAPAPNMLPDVRSMAGALQSHLPDGEVAVRAAAYRASTRDFSFRMSIADVQRLEALLELKPGTCPRAEHVELVRTDSVRGLLVFRHDGAKTRIIFEYFAPDERRCGTALFTVARGDESAIDRVRAIVASFRVAEG